MEYYTKRALLPCYKGLLRDFLLKKYQQFCYSSAIKNTFGKNEEMQTILDEEITSYVEGLKVELEVLNFMFKNNKKLDSELISLYFNTTNEKYESEFSYFNQLFDNLSDAIEMELANKFYKPKGGFTFSKSEDVSKYINYLKGYHLDQVKRMLFLEEVYAIETNTLNSLVVLDEMNVHFQNVKELDADVLSNLDLFGVFEKDGKISCTIPKVVSESSSYVAVHQMIHLALLERKEEIDDDSVVYGEDLPIFYEYLFGEYYLSSFAEKGPIDVLTDIAGYLLDTYNYESFDEQIEKVKRIK